MSDQYTPDLNRTEYILRTLHTIEDSNGQVHYLVNWSFEIGQLI